MKPACILREKLESEEPVLGVLVTQHLWMELIDVALAAGLDYIIIDREHMGHGHQEVADFCRLGRLANFPVLLRPTTASLDMVRMAMDLGPCGLLLPMVESAAQLDEVRDGLYLPPRGQRRPGGAGNRWVTRYDYETFRSEVEDNLIVLPQIESPLGMENVDEIIAHEITTALAVGPYDLSARLGICGQMDDPKLIAAIDGLKQAAARVGKKTWMIGDGTSLLKQGFRFFCIGEPTWIMQAAIGKMVEELRG